jgi:hypothetical protein
MATDRDRALAALRVLRERRQADDKAYEQAELAAVKAARRVELSWEQIATALDRTRSGVWKRYHQITD